MMKWALCFVLTMMVCLTTYQDRHCQNQCNIAQEEVNIEEWGTAIMSFYADFFEGRQTANGEIFSQQGFTCAHRTLPFGTLVALRSPATSETVVVRVNDRGPFIKGREFDVSEAVFEKLDNKEQGLAKIEYRILDSKKV